MPAPQGHYAAPRQAEAVTLGTQLFEQHDVRFGMVIAVARCAVYPLFCEYGVPDTRTSPVGVGGALDLRRRRCEAVQEVGVEDVPPVAVGSHCPGRWRGTSGVGMERSVRGSRHWVVESARSMCRVCGALMTERAVSKSRRGAENRPQQHVYKSVRRGEPHGDHSDRLTCASRRSAHPAAGRPAARCGRQRKDWPVVG